MNQFVRSAANDDFSRARTREKLQKILNLLTPARDEMLALHEVRELLKPSSESYRGLQTVPVERIVGSEGRYADFNKRFLPRHEHLRGRWTRVDEAHITSVTLPPIRVYEIGGVYFVRDGNHRVSVARSQGAIDIDAEVTSLDSAIAIDPEMTRDDLRTAVIEYEKHQFYDTTRFNRVFPDYDLRFTATGRYEETLRHIYDHKYYINMNQKEEILFEGAMRSWFENVYMPIVEVIREQRLLSLFIGRTEADLYVWIVKHWDELKRRHGDEFSIEEAASDFAGRFGKSFLRRAAEALAERRRQRAKQRRIARGRAKPEDLV